MTVYIIRHAIAEEREEFAKTGKPDQFRPLTSRGKKKMKLVAQGLSQIIGNQVDWMATSDFMRAEQTAEILASKIQGQRLETWSELQPESTPQKIRSRMQKKSEDSTGIIIGHEPLLSEFLRFALFGIRGGSNQVFSFLELKKGAVACLDLNLSDPSQSKLKWLIPPAVWVALAQS